MSVATSNYTVNSINQGNLDATVKVYESEPIDTECVLVSSQRYDKPIAVQDGENEEDK